MSAPAFNGSEIIASLARTMCVGRVRGSSVFLSTGVTYPNGVGVTVRIHQGQNGLAVSDDGYANTIAETMGALATFHRVAPGVAGRSGIEFEKGEFHLYSVEMDTLANAVGLVANTSARALERVVASLEQPRIKKSRDLFDKKLRAAYGDQVTFDFEFTGATGRAWQFGAGVLQGGIITRLFELVSPTTQSVALANMKILDARALHDAPSITAALADYEGTEPALRAILSSAGSFVISANDDVENYRLNAA